MTVRWPLVQGVVCIACLVSSGAPSARANDFAYIFTRNYVSIVDSRSGTPEKTILTRDPMFGPMSDILFSPDGSVAYLIDGVLPGIRRLDVRTGRLATPLTVPGVWLPLERGVLSPDGRWLYATYNDSLLVIDPTTGRAKTGICVGRDAEDVALTPDGRKAYVAIHERFTELDGFVAVVDLEEGRVEKQIPMPRASRNLAMSPDGGAVYVPNPAHATVSVIDTATDEVAAVIDGALFKSDVVFAPDGSLAYVATSDAESGISVIDTAKLIVVDSIALPFRGERLAITSDGSLLYVTHGDGSCAVSVVDTRKRALAGSVDASGALGVAFTSVARETSPARRVGSSVNVTGAASGLCAYVSHSLNDLISVIDLSAAEIVGQIPVQRPTQMVADSPRSLVYALGTTNGGTAADLTVINATTNEIVSSTPVPRDTSGSVDINKDAEFAVLTNSTPCSRLARVDIATGAVTYFLPPDSSGATVIGVVIEPQGRFAYVTSSYSEDVGFKISVADVETLSLVDEIPFPHHRPDRIVFTPDNRFAYVSARPVLDDPPGATGDERGFVMVIDTASHQIVSQIPVQNNPGSMAISSDGQSVYAANSTSKSLSVIDTPTNQVRATIPLDSSPAVVAVSPDGASAYVVSILSQDLSVIDLASGSIVDTIPLPFFSPDVEVLEVPGGCVPPPPQPTPIPVVAPRFFIGCVGDCNDDFAISIDEILLGARIALGELPPSSCALADWNRDDRVSIEELVEAVRNAIEGCPVFSCEL